VIALSRGFLLSVLCIGLLHGSPARGQQPASADAGAAAYGELCAGCHADPAALRRAVTGATAEQRRAALDRLLRRHHARDADKRMAVIDWLERTRPASP